MAFGVKLKNVTTKNEYTIEELYSAIKDKTFSAGVPSLTKHGPTTIITFPALDSQNQVWIMRGGFAGKTKKWTVQKSQEAGMGNVALNMAKDKLTGGLFGFGAVVGNKVKECERLVDATAKELAELSL